MDRTVTLVRGTLLTLTQNTEDCTCVQSSLNPEPYFTIKDRRQAEFDNINCFTEELLKKRVDNSFDITVIDGIDRSGYHTIADTPKSIVICCYLHRDTEVQDVLECIKQTAEETNLDRKINVIFKSWEIPLFFLENDKGLQQDSVRCILWQSALPLEQIISDYPGIAIEFATLSARYNCLPVTGAQFLLAKLFDNTFSKALFAYSNRQNFKHLSELVAEKPSKRAGLLTQLVSKEHTAQVFIERILKHNEHLEHLLLATLEGIPRATSCILDSIAELEVEINGWIEKEDPEGAAKLALLYALQRERESCNRALLQAVSSTCSLLLALNEKLTVDVGLCISGEIQPPACREDPLHFRQVVDDKLKEHNQHIVARLLEAVHSGNHDPFPTICSFAVHALSSFNGNCHLCKGDCEFYAPREFVPEDFIFYNAYLQLKELIIQHPLDTESKAFIEYIDTFLPLEKLRFKQTQGDRIYLEALRSFVDSLFKKRADLVARDHPDEQAYIFNGLRRIEPHREEDARHYVQALKILLSILHLRETTGVKSWSDAEKWIRNKVTRIFENITGRVIAGPYHGKHQTDFIEAIKKNIVKALKALWQQQRLDRDHLRLNASKEKPKFQNILKICKRGVTLLSQQLVTATEEPLQSYDPTLTIAAQVVHEFFNHLLEQNRAHVNANENFKRDGEAFLLQDRAEGEELKRFQLEHTQVVHSQFENLQSIRVFPVVQADCQEQTEVPVAQPEPSDENDPQIQRVNPVTQVCNSDLQTSPDNAHLLQQAWNDLDDFHLPQDLIADLPPLVVSCASINPVAQTAEGRPLSPADYTDGQSPAKRARTEGYATENPVYQDEADVVADCEEQQGNVAATAVETIDDATATCDNEVGRDLSDTVLGEVIDEFFGNDGGYTSDSSDLQSCSSDEDYLASRE